MSQAPAQMPNTPPRPSPVDAVKRDLQLFFGNRPTPDSAEAFSKLPFNPIAMCNNCKEARAECVVTYHRPKQSSCERCYDKAKAGCDVARWDLIKVIWMGLRAKEGKGYPVEYDLPFEMTAGDATLLRDADGRVTWTYVPRDPYDATMPFGGYH
jgi:hypothetical protein